MRFNIVEEKKLPDLYLRLWCCVARAVVVFLVSIAGFTPTSSAFAATSIEEACRVIVNNPKVLGANESECQCVLKQYESSVDPAMLQAEIEYFKEPDRQKRFKIEWDLALSLPPRQFKKIVDELNAKAVAQCGTDMRYVKSSGSLKNTNDTAKTDTKSNRVATAKKQTDDNTKTLNGGSDQAIVTHYNWPNWWNQPVVAAGNIESLKTKEVVSVYWLGRVCEVRYLDFKPEVLHRRKVRLPHVPNKAACKTNLPAVERYSFKNAGLTAIISKDDSRKGIVVREESSDTHVSLPIKPHGQLLPGLKEQAMSNCDSVTEVCQGNVDPVFWDAEGRHVISNHRIKIFNKAIAAEEAPISVLDRKHFPSGIIPAGTTIQYIRTTIRWMSGGEPQADSCIGVWLGVNTLEKPASSSWGCGRARKGSSTGTDFILDK